MKALEGLRTNRKYSDKDCGLQDISNLLRADKGISRLKR